MKTKLLFLTLLCAAFGGSLFAQGQSQNVKGSFGAGPPGSSTPCTKAGDEYTDISASQQYVATAISQTSNSTSCTWTLSGSGSGSTAPGRSIDPTNVLYGAKFDATVVPDGTTTNSSNIVTCPNSDCKFLTGAHPALAGMVFFANAGNGSSCLDNADILFGGLRQTTISTVDSDTQIHVVGNAGTTATGTACMAWGSDDTTAINAAWTAGGCTSSQWLPIGKALVSAPIWQATALGTCPSVAANGTGYQGPRIWGSSVTGTYVIPVPLFNFASITGGCGTATTPANCTAAIGEPNISDYENFEVWGVGERCSATLANTTLFLIGVSTRFVNAAGVGWCGRGGGATLIGHNINGTTDIYNYAGTQFFGSININFNGQNILFGNSAVSANPFNTNNACAVNLVSGASVSSISNLIAGDVCNAGAVWNSQNTTITGNDAAGGCMTLTTNSVVNFIANDNVCQNPQTNEEAIFYAGAGTNAVVHAKNSNIFSNGTAPCVAGAANNTFDDQGGNVFTCGATGGIFNGLGAWLADGHSVKGICTGVGTAASTLGLYGTGDNVTLTTCTSAAIGAGIVNNGVHILQNLVVSATAAGTNVSSGVVTVLVNGSGSAITCTIGTGTSCLDQTHKVTLADGDRVSIQFTTQAADTLAGIKALVTMD